MKEKKENEKNLRIKGLVCRILGHSRAENVIQNEYQMYQRMINSKNWCMFMLPAVLLALGLLCLFFFFCFFATILEVGMRVVQLSAICSLTARCHWNLHNVNLVIITTYPHAVLKSVKLHSPPQQCCSIRKKQNKLIWRGVIYTLDMQSSLCAYSAAS